MPRIPSAALAFTLMALPIMMGANGPGCGTVVTGGGGEPGDPGTEPGYPGDEPVGNPAPVCGPELHILGVYETHSNHGGGDHPAGAATVHVEREGAMVLALSSYEPVHWSVTAVPGAAIEKVILNGYHDQTADVPPGVPVEIHAGPESWLGAYAYAWPSSEGGSDTQALVSALEGEAGREMTSFHGCYSASSFVLHDDLSVASSCDTDAGYEVTGHVETSCDTPSCGPELHLVTVYESHSNHGHGYHPPGAATVHVDRQGSMVLALSSYEPVHWSVTAAPGAVIEKVILNGYHDQTADVPPGVPVETYDGEQMLAACAYEWPGDDQGCDTQGLVSALEGLTDRTLTSFNGCYHADAFVLNGDLSASSTCNTAAGYTPNNYVATCDEPAPPP